MVGLPVSWAEGWSSGCWRSCRKRRREHSGAGQVCPAGGGTPWREAEAPRKGGAGGYLAQPPSLHTPLISHGSHGREQSPEACQRPHPAMGLRDGGEQGAREGWGEPNRGSSELCSWGHSPKVSVIPGSPSRGPPVIWLISQLSEVIVPPDPAASADPGANEDHQLFSFCLSAFSLLVPHKVKEDKSLGLLPPLTGSRRVPGAGRPSPGPPALSARSAQGSPLGFCY